MRLNRRSSEMLWHLNFSRASADHFRVSRYIMGLTDTPESKVMAVWICRELTCSISSVSIYYTPESEIQLKSYDHSDFLRASMVHFLASWNINNLTHTPKSKVMLVWIFWELPWTISRVSIYLWAWIGDILVKSYDLLNFLRASDFYFRASRYIMGLTHTNESKVIAVWICRELRVEFQGSRFIMRQNWRSEWNVMTIWISWEPLLSIFQRLVKSWPSQIHLSQKLWLFELAESFMLSFKRLDILCA